LVCLVVLAGVTLAQAADKVTLKGGKVVEGTIVREVEGAVWIKTSVGGVEVEEMYGPNDISTIQRDAASAPAKAEPVTTGVPTLVKPKSGSSVPKACVITMGDEENGHMVGIYMTADILHRAIPALEEELGTDRTGVVVLRFHSGGGMGSEVQKISDVIQNELKPRFRTVGWIESAISAAAMSAHCLEEIYFTTQGNYGACVGFYGSLDKPVQGRELEDALFEMEKISARGGYNPLIMRAMQVQQPLSAHIDENGEVHWYGDVSSGEIIVNRPKDILTFNAVTATKVKFSKGTADSLEELAKAMGYQELDWVGKQVKGVPWPVTKAEKMQMDFRHQVHEDEGRTNEYYTTYQLNIQAAASEQDPVKRGAFVGRARSCLDKIKHMVKNNPAFRLTIFGGRENYNDWLDKQEKLLRELTRK
jgi:hypothetical protein